MITIAPDHSAQVLKGGVFRQGVLRLIWQECGIDFARHNYRVAMTDIVAHNKDDIEIRILPNKIVQNYDTKYTISS
jgi:hypothetical protein